MKIKKRYVVIVSLILLCLRILCLEHDIPNWQIAYYTPLDEGCYAMQGMYMARPDWKGQIDELGTDGLKEWNSAVSFSLTLCTALTMRIWGNNYYGLWMAEALAGIFVSLIVLWLIYQQRKDKNWHWGYLCALFLLAFNFSFLLATRIAEPSVFRSLLIMLGVWYVFQKRETSNFGILGALCTSAVVWGYVTNVFVFIAAATLLGYLFFSGEKKKACRGGAAFICGCIIFFLFSEGIMYLVQKRTFLQDTLRVVLGHETKRVAVTYDAITENIKAIFSSNMFAYNIVFFVVAAVSVFYCLGAGIRKRKPEWLYSAMVAVGFIIQGIFTTDFLQRKSIVIFPVLVLCIGIFVMNISVYITGKKPRYFFILLCLALMVFEVRHSFQRIMNLAEEDMPDIFKAMLLGTLAVSIFVFTITLLTGKHKIILAGKIAALLLPDVLMDYKYIIQTNDTEKQTMLELAQIVGNDYVLGLGYSYCLYNDIIPASNVYDAYYEDDYIKRSAELCREGKVKYYLSYAGTDYMKNFVADQKHTWIKIRDFATDYNDGPGESELHDIGLFQYIEVCCINIRGWKNYASENRWT